MRDDSNAAPFKGTHVLYRLFDAGGALLYIGITNDLRMRFGAHASTQPWWYEVVDCRTEFVSSRAALEAAEAIAIQTEQPKYNKRLQPRTPRLPIPVRRSRVEDLVVDLGTDYGLIVEMDPLIVVRRDGAVLEKVGGRWRAVCNGRLLTAALHPGHERCEGTGRRHFCSIYGPTANELARTLGL